MKKETESKKVKSFIDAVNERKKLVIEYLFNNNYQKLFSPPNLHKDLSAAVIGEIKSASNMWHCYIRRGGKALRPAVLLFSCGAVGGNEEKAISAAAAVEVWHTYTLIHDDIIDNDPVRRHEKSVHEFYYELGKNRGLNELDAKRYGVSIGILAGDLLNGWAKHLLTNLYVEKHVKPEVALALIRELDGNVTISLSTGQNKDVYFENQSIETITINEIVSMLREKTAILYEYAGRAGAMIGLDTSDMNHPLVKLLADITCKCGIAFQLQDDILGVIGKTEKTGKPVSSDIIKGKRTTIVRYSWENANRNEQKKLEYLINLGERLSSEQLQETKELLLDLKGIDGTKKLASKFVGKASRLLEKIPKNDYSCKYITLLKSWIDFMVNRNL